MSDQMTARQILQKLLEFEDLDVPCGITIRNSELFAITDVTEEADPDDANAMRGIFSTE